jgi:hypothetical protein
MSNIQQNEAYKSGLKNRREVMGDAVSQLMFLLSLSLA